MQRNMDKLPVIFKTAEQRYIEILDRQPGIVQRTPSQYLASYLGITPESFSRVKRKHSAAMRRKTK